MRHRTAVLLILTIMAAGCACGPAMGGDAFSAAIERFNAGRWSEAAMGFVAAVGQMPNDVVVRLTAGVALATAKRYADAVRQFEEAARLSPDGILPQLLIDGTSQELGQVAKSRRARERANLTLRLGGAFGTPTSSDQALASSLVKYPANAIAHCLLGDLYQLQGKLPQAKERYAQASRLAPEWAKPVFNLGMASLETDPKAAAESLDRAVKMDPSNGRVRLWLGDAYLKQGKHDEAVAEYQTAGKDGSLAAEARTRMGNAELRAGNYSAAAQQYGYAAKQAPQDARPIAGQAEAYQSAGNLREAEQQYNKAARILAANNAPGPSQAVVQNQIAVVRSQQGRMAEAAASYRSAFELHPTPENADALVRADQREANLAHGIAMSEEKVKKNAGDKTALLYLLYAYRASGKQANRAEVARKLTRADPAGATRYYAELGAAKMSLGDIPEGAQAYSRAFTLGDATTWPDTARSAASSGALGRLQADYRSQFDKGHKLRPGLILFEIQSARGDVAGMLETAGQLVKAYPDNPALWLRLGEASERAGRKDDAVAAYTKAVAAGEPEAAALARSRIEALRSGGKAAK